MSSYIVDKKEFIKAAGLMYGIEEAKRDKHLYFLEVCRKEFVHCYALNVISVNEQYGEDYAPDEASYDEEFEEHRKLGKLIGNDGYTSSNGIIYHKVENVMSLKDLRLRMQRFFGSVLYQIENETCHRTVAAWFYTCITKLYERDLRSIEGWHTEIELKQEMEKLKAA